MWKFQCLVAIFSLANHLSSSNAMPANNPSVIIVGAGPSGIAAATKLLENGITNIKVLEGQNRIGGRVNSVKFGDGMVDVGAEYCHGGKGNLVNELVKDMNLLEPFPKYADKREDKKIIFYYSNGSSEIDDSIGVHVLDLTLTLEETETDFDKNDMSIGEFYDRIYNSTISKIFPNDPETVKILTEALNTIESFSNSLSGAFSWYEVNIVDNYEYSEDPSDYIWKGTGYKTFLDVLMKKYPDPSKKLDIDNKILLNKTVTKVEWKQKDGVVVHCSEEAFKADYVIFTPSLGVLKATADELFVPELPASKKAAIKALGFGGFMKIILRFPDRWWKEGLRNFAFIWSREALNELSEQFPNGPYDNDDGIPWVSKIVSVSFPIHKEPVMIVWVTGPAIHEVEKLPSETLQKGVMYTLKKFLGVEHNISEPVELIRSTWFNNPHVRGSYSYLSTGFYEDDVSYNSLLAEPLKNADDVPVLLFAGEATSPTHFSTVHGAVETGFREANRIITLHNETVRTPVSFTF